MGNHTGTKPGTMSNAGAVAKCSAPANKGGVFFARGCNIEGICYCTYKCVISKGYDMFTNPRGTEPEVSNYADISTILSQVPSDHMACPRCRHDIVAVPCNWRGRHHVC